MLLRASSREHKLIEPGTGFSVKAQLLSHKKEISLGPGREMQETQFFSTGQSISSHKGLPMGESGASCRAALKLSKKNPLLATDGEAALRGLPHDRNPLYQPHI